MVLMQNLRSLYVWWLQFRAIVQPTIANIITQFQVEPGFHDSDPGNWIEAPIVYNILLKCVKRM